MPIEQTQCGTLDDKYMWKFIGGLFTGIVVTIITIIILMVGFNTTDDDNDIRYFDEPIELKIENKYCEEIEIIQTNYPFCICEAKGEYIWETYTVALSYDEKYFDDYTMYINSKPIK